MKKRYLVLIAIVLLIGTAAAVHAQNRRGMFARHGMHGGHGGFAIAAHLHRLADELDLSGAQRDQIKTILRDMHEQNAAQRQQLHGGYMEIAQTLIANPSDTAAAQALLDRQTAAERALKSNMLTASAKALSVLTPEQRAKLGEHLEDRFERRARNRR